MDETYYMKKPIYKMNKQNKATEEKKLKFFMLNVVSSGKRR